MAALSSLTARCAGGSGGWASNRLLQENDHSPQEPEVPVKDRAKIKCELKKRIVLFLFFFLLLFLPPPQ